MISATDPSDKYRVIEQEYYGKKRYYFYNQETKRFQKNVDVFKETNTKISEIKGIPDKEKQLKVFIKYEIKNYRRTKDWTDDQGTLYRAGTIAESMIHWRTATSEYLNKHQAWEYVNKNKEGWTDIYKSSKKHFKNVDVTVVGGDIIEEAKYAE